MTPREAHLTRTRVNPLEHSSQISRNRGSNHPRIYWIFRCSIINADKFDADEPLLLDFRVESVLR